MTQEQLEEKLIVGAKIKIGKESSLEQSIPEGEIITLVDGDFEYDNGLYTENQSCPAIWNESANEFDSIYHLFGNHLENFLDSEILNP